MKPEHDDIYREPAGPRLDAWVAEYVMGWENVSYGSIYPKFSTNSAQAVHALEKVVAEGFAFEIRVEPGKVLFDNHDLVDRCPLKGWCWEDDTILMEGETFALAVARGLVVAKLYAVYKGERTGIRR